ncbi:hypothetical protein [Sulfurimonas sp.]|uniref:hypothetical protein n=1 Tax=Sulfurimonas sp. TaxID=2022749 RepID=UPI003D0FF521
MSVIKQLYSSSLLEKQYLLFLKDPTITTISFDLFETLLFRKVALATDIFKLVGNSQYVLDIFESSETFTQLRIEAEQSARQKYSFKEEVTIYEIYEQLPLLKEQISAIIDIELLYESENIFFNQQILHWIELATLHNKNIIFTSDMYLSKPQLQKIIPSNLDTQTFMDKFYISCECNATKANGSMYEHIVKNENITYVQLLHIGDNPSNDVAKAKQYGIHTLHYCIDEQLKQSLLFESNYMQNSLTPMHNVRILSSIVNPYEDKKQKFFFNLGASIFGPLLWEFSHWINELAKKHDVTQINTIMREGRTFYNALQQITRDKELNLIYASRKSTLLPSLDQKKIFTEGINLFFYRKLKVADLYAILKLPIHDKIIASNQNTLIKDASKIVFHGESFVNIIASDLNTRISEIQKNIKSEKLLFQKYLSSLNFSQKSLLVEFGGTGSILQNIKNAMEIPNQLNVLLYMHESGFKTMLHDKVFTFFPYTSTTKNLIETIRRTPEFIEILLNGNHQTTLCYQENEDGTISPQTTTIEMQDKDFSNIIESFDNGVNSFFTIAKEYNIGQKLFTRESLLKMLARIIDFPTSKEAHFLGELFYDEGSYENSKQKIIKNQDIQSIKELGVYESYLNSKNDLSYKIDEITWINGTITLIEPGFISKVNGFNIKSVNNVAINSIIKTFEELPKYNNIYIYGAGQFATELLTHTIMQELQIKAIIDTKAQIHSFKFLDFDVLSLNEIIFEKNDVVIVASAVFANDITDTIIQYLKTTQQHIAIINHKKGLVVYE